MIKLHGGVLSHAIQRSTENFGRKFESMINDDFIDIKSEVAIMIESS